MISPTDRFIAMSSKHGVFNSDLIANLRKDDNMVNTIEELCIIIANIMAPNIEYLGHEIVDERVKYPCGYVQLYDSDLYCVEYKFKVTGKDKTGAISSSYKKMVFEIPTLINGEYYYINGDRYYPIYQLLDRTTYHKDNSVTLKTLTLPIKLTRNPVTFADINNNEYSAFLFYIDIQKKKVNMLSFFFSTIGFLKTLKFFEGSSEQVQSIFSVISEDKVIPNDQNNLYFQLSKTIFLRVNAEFFKRDINVRSIVACILEITNKRLSINELLNVNYWKYEVFGRYYVKNKNSIKANKIDLFIQSFKRLYDSITEENMRLYEVPKSNIYEVIRWMFINFPKLLYRDNASIFNKRVRLSEYQIAHIVRRLMSKTQRVMNNSERGKTLAKYEDILTLPYKFSIDASDRRKIEQASDILCKSIINSNNTKYADCVNDMNLFNIALKWTLNAPSTTASKGPKSNSLSLQQRAQSPTFIGVISLNTSGAGDPGGTGAFTPFVKMYNGSFVPKKEN